MYSQTILNIQILNVQRLIHICAAAAAAAKSLQLCPTLCHPIDGSPPGSPVPGILQARILEWVAISFSNAWKWKVKVKLLSQVGLLATPWTATYQAPLSKGFSRQEYWSGVPLPSPHICTHLCNYHPHKNIHFHHAQYSSRSSSRRGSVLYDFMKLRNCFKKRIIPHSAMVI